MTTVVVSPHLDDAVLSVPAWIASRAAREAVIVLTVCSEGDAVYVGRRAEDRAALALLGATPLHLGLLDAPFRRGVPRSFRGLILGELADDDADAAAVTDALVARVTALAPDEVVLPLGVGEHIDHRIVHAAHAALPGRVGFYADRPYADVAHAIDARLARIGATVDDVAVAPSRAAAGAFLAAARAAAFVRAYLPEDQREACLRPLAAPLVRPSPTSGLRLCSEQRTFDDAARRLAIRAVQVYASQVTDLFGDGDGVAAAFAGPHAEAILWR